MAAFARVDAAFDLGTRAVFQKNTTTTLRLARSSVTLVAADGTATPAGLHYYRRLGVEPPTTFAYEQPLIEGQWVLDREGKWQQVRRMVHGAWEVTKKGEAYFRYNRDPVSYTHLTLPTIYSV